MLKQKDNEANFLSKIESQMNNVDSKGQRDQNTIDILNIYNMMNQDNNGKNNNLFL